MSKPRKKRLNTVSQAMQLLNEQINEVRNDDTISKQDKARTIGYLMGQWAKLKNIPEEDKRGQQQMNALTGSINASMQMFGAYFKYDGKSRIEFEPSREEEEQLSQDRAEPSQDRAMPRESQTMPTTGGLTSNHTNGMF